MQGHTVNMDTVIQLGKTVSDIEESGHPDEIWDFWNKTFSDKDREPTTAATAITI